MGLIVQTVLVFSRNGTDCSSCLSYALCFVAVCSCHRRWGLCQGQLWFWVVQQFKLLHMHTCTYNGSCPKKVSFVLEMWAASVQCQWNMSDCIQAVYLFILSCNEVKGYKFILEVFLSTYVSRFYLDVIFNFWLALSVETNLVWWCIMHHPPCVMRTCWFLSSVSRSQWGFIWLKNMTFCVYWAKSTPCFLTALVLASLPCGPVE